MHRPWPDEYVDAIQCGEIPWDYDVDLWLAERGIDDDAAAGDLARKAEKEGSA